MTCDVPLEGCVSHPGRHQKDLLRHFSLFCL